MGRAIAGLACVLMLLSPSTAPAAPTPASAPAKPAAPIRIERGAATEAEYRKAVLDFNRRTLVDAYKTIGKRDPKWDEPALKLLDAVAVYFSNAGAHSRHRIPQQPRKDIQAHGKAAVDAGCDDAIVLYCYAAMLDDAGKDDEALSLLRRAVQLIPQSRYPMNRAFSAARRMAGHAERQNDDAAAEQYHRLTRDFALASISVAEFKSLDRRIVLGLVRDWFEEQSPEQQKSFCDDAAKLNSDPWMLHILTGEYHYNAGWAARGNDFADKVKDEGWRIFREQIPQAGRHFIAAWKLEKNFPEPATRMINVAMCGHAPEGDERTWFARATAAQFDYAPAYRNMLLALLPRWGGTHRRMFEFGLDCAATQRYDTDVPWMLVEAVERIEKDDRDVHMDRTTQVWSREGVYEKVREVVSTYARNAQGAQRLYYRSYLAGVAWQMGEYAEAGQIVIEMGEKVDRSAMLRTGLLPQRMTGAFDLASGPHAASVARAEDAARERDFATALKLYEELATKVSDPAPAAAWVRNRTQELKWKIGFEAGEWVDLMPADERLAGWYPTGGTWTKHASGALYGITKADGLAILCGGDFGKRFELTGKLEFDPNPALKEVSVGPIIAWSTSGKQHQVFLRKKEQAVVVRRNAYVYGRYPTTLKSGGTFELKVFDGLAWGGANGKPLFNALDLADFTVEDATLIGVSGQNTAQLRVRYRHLKVRKLKQQPADAATQPVAKTASRT